MNRLLVPPVQAKAPAKGSLYLYDAIGADGWGGGISERDVVEALAELRAQGVKSLEVRINSPGGSVFSGLAMYEAIKNFPGEKEAFVDGLAASAASFVMLAADKVHCTPSSVVMIHEAAGVAFGNAKAMEDTAAILRKANDSIVAIYTARTGKPEAEIRQWMADETWMTGQECVDKGFCSDCVEDTRPPVGADDDGDEPEDKAPKMSEAAQIVAATFKKAPPDLFPGASTAALRNHEMRILHQRLAATASGRRSPGQPGSAVQQFKK